MNKERKERRGDKLELKLELEFGLFGFMGKEGKDSVGRKGKKRRGWEEKGTAD